MWPAGLCCCGGQMCRIQRQKKAITDTTGRGPFISSPWPRRRRRRQLIVVAGTAARARHLRTTHA